MNFNITRPLWILVLMLYHCSAGAVAFPTIENMRIARCKPHATWPSAHCEIPVYASDGTVFVDLGGTARPERSMPLKIFPFSVECSRGSPRLGIPFSSCLWARNYGSTSASAPVMTGKCELSSYESWEFTADSTCATAVGEWYGAYAVLAEPGFQCVIFAQDYPEGTTGSRGPINTLYGLLDPTVVANSGNAYCQKSIPPNVTCNVTLPSQIDHGIVTPSASSTASIIGTVDCGDKPKVEFVGGSSVKLGDGVITQLSYQMSGSQSVRVVSNMTTSNSLPGVYSASVIIVVSPF